MLGTVSMDNPAIPVRDASGQISAEEKFADCCADPLLFAMRDNYHEFVMGLFTILQCLRLAEKEGHVPSLPEGWWVQLAIRYNLKL
ncbi:MAG: XRE family transcriptional regulator [Desulfovibrio sp.]|jgi:hypothetical protein|nr:XRE family transcriptional regulator [Desulfovibrio sp.]